MSICKARLRNTSNAIKGGKWRRGNFAPQYFQKSAGMERFVSEISCHVTDETR